MPTTLPSLVRSGWRSAPATKWLATGAAAAALIGTAAVYRYEVASDDSPARETPSTRAARLGQENCMEGALLFHDVRWAAACMMLAEQDEARHGACLEDPVITGNPELGTAYCDRTFGHVDGSPECELPDARAKRLYGLLGDDEQKCKAEAKASAAR